VIWCLSNITGIKDFKVKNELIDTNIQKYLIILFDMAKNVNGYQTKSNIA